MTTNNFVECEGCNRDCDEARFRDCSFRAADVVVFDEGLKWLSKSPPLFFLIETGKGDRGGYTLKAMIFGLKSAIAQFHHLSTDPANFGLRRRIVAVFGRRNLKITLVVARPHRLIDSPSQVPEYVRTHGLFGSDELNFGQGE